MKQRNLTYSYRGRLHAKVFFVTYSETRSHVSKKVRRPIREQVYLEITRQIIGRLREGQ
jgi:hypothetical protein